MATKNLYILDATGETFIVGGDADGRASDALKLGGKAPEYYIQPRNLLDNSDFTNPVNQRGQTSYSAAGYTIDRWKTIGALSVTVDDGCITLENTGSSVLRLDQGIPLEKVQSGNTYTVAVCTKDGRIRCGSFSLSTTAAAPVSESDFYIHVVLSYTVATVQLRQRAGCKTSYEWIALYEGSYTADTLPPYVPKGYTAELAECQRYYRRSFNGEVKNISYVGTPIVIAANTTSLQTIIFDMPMRVAPTVTTYGYKNKQVNSVSDWVADADITNTKISYVSSHGFTVGTDTPVFTTNKAYCFHYEASADL